MSIYHRSLIAFAALILIGCQSQKATSQNRQNTAGFCENFDSLSRLKPDELEFEKILEIEPMTEGFAILEGPLWTDKGLLMSHIGKSKDDRPNPSDLVRLENGELTTVKKGYGGNGLAIDPSGNVVAALHKNGTVSELYGDRTFATHYDGQRFNSPNDLVFSTTSQLYFTDPDWQSPKPAPQSQERAYHVNPAGKAAHFASEVKKPNGIALSHDESFVYVGGVNGLFKYPLSDDGQVGGTATHIEAVGGNIDGMSRDCAGNLFITADGHVKVLDVNDELLAQFEIPGATNVAFGGSDGKRIFVTSLGGNPSVYAAQSNIPGLPY